MYHLSVVLLYILAAVLPAPVPPVSERWHAWPVSRVFPGTVPGYSPSGARVTYVLAGVAPEAPCRLAFQAAAVRPGCRTALRATYTDSTQTFVVTVGIAVLNEPGGEPDGGLQSGPQSGLQDGPGRVIVRPVAFPRGERPATVRPVAFPGGPAERFGDRQYVTGVVIGPEGHYLVATAAGYADGRAYRPGENGLPRLRHAARQLATALHRALTR